MTSMYEGIALIQEKQAVVLDLGTEYTKFGFAGEAAPRCIVRAELWCPEARAVRRVHDYCSPDQLYHNLVHHLHQLYFRHVLVNPKERKVVVVESLLAPTLLRETLARVLYAHYEVAAVLWADAPRAAALPLGAPVALVLDLGGAELTAAAVLHGAVLPHALQAAPLGARALHAELRRLLEEHRGGPLPLTDHDLEDIKVKTCFVIDRARALQWQSEQPPAACPGVQYSAGARGAVTVPGRARELAAEVMFARDGEQSSLPELVLRCILAAPRDERRELAANLVVVGGGAALPGLRARLAAELRALLLEEPWASRLWLPAVKFHTPPCHANSAAWCGGALLAGEARATPRDAYVRARRLPDWVCLLDNTPPDHPARSLPDP